MTALRMRQHLGCAVWHLREAIAEAPDSTDLGDADGAVQQLATDPQGYFATTSWQTDHEVVALLDGQARPVPAVAEIAAALRGSEPRIENSVEMERRELLHLLDAGALLGGQAEMVYDPRQCVLEMRARRDDEQLQGDTWATAAVLRGPPHWLGVTADCGALQRLAKSLPGATLGLDLGDVLGGPGVRLWPAEELPDGARVVLVMRAAAGAQVHAEQEEHVDAAA